MPPAKRWPALLLELESTSWTRATDLARALGVSERTVYRDAQALVEAGIPLQGVPGKGYRLPEDYMLAPVQLTTDEAVMLVLGSAYAAQNFDGRYRAAADTAQHKLERLLPAADREHALSLRGTVSLTSPSVFGDPAEESLLRQVRHALVEEQTIEVSLATAAAPKRTLDPYGLVRQGATWHIVGHDHQRSRVVHVRLATIERIERTSESFERPESYGASPDHPTSSPDQQVRVLFSAEAAAVLQVPPALTIAQRERLSDDRLLLTLRVETERSLLPWLLGWGAHAKVVEPQALRSRIATEAQAVADQYTTAPTLLDG
jgi:predicted DNA-binding transcriptional regulator YafY